MHCSKLRAFRFQFKLLLEQNHHVFFYHGFDHFRLQKGPLHILSCQQTSLAGSPCRFILISIGTCGLLD